MARRKKNSFKPYMSEVLASWGREYTPVLLPKDIRRGAVGDCFDHCALEAARLKNKYYYVEGLATNPENGSKWVYHAWLTDVNGKFAYDPTWAAYKGRAERSVPSRYIGIKMNIYRVAEFISATGYRGVFANRWRNVELADQAISGGPQLISVKKHKGL